MKTPMRSQASPDAGWAHDPHVGVLTPRRLFSDYILMRFKPGSKYPRWLMWTVVISDIVLINGAFLLAYYLRYRLQLFLSVDPAFDNPPEVFAPFQLVLTALLLLAFKIDGVYESRRLSMWLDQMWRIVRATMMAILILIGVTFFYQPFFYSRLIFLYASALIVVLLGIGRLLWGVWLGRLRRRGIGVVRVLVVGAGEVGRTVIRTVMAQPEFGYRIVGLIDDQLDNTLNIGPVPALEGLDRIPQVVAEQRVDEVVVALPWNDHRRILDIFQQCDRLGVRARTVPDLFQLSLNRVDVEDLGGIPLIGLRLAAIHGANLLVKRIMDMALGSLIMIAVLPIMGLLALAISSIRPARSSSGKSASACTTPNLSCTNSARCGWAPKKNMPACWCTTK